MWSEFLKNLAKKDMLFSIYKRFPFTSIGNLAKKYLYSSTLWRLFHTVEKFSHDEEINESFIAQLFPRYVNLNNVIVFLVVIFVLVIDLCFFICFQ